MVMIELCFVKIRTVVYMLGMIVLHPVLIFISYMLYRIYNETWVKWSVNMTAGPDIKLLFYMPIGHMVLKIDVPCKIFHVPRQYLYKHYKAYVYCWVNKYLPWLKKSLAQSGT